MNNTYEGTDAVCSHCVSVEYEDVKLLGGKTSPYRGGLVGCRKRGVGHYPNQEHSCSDFSRAEGVRDFVLENTIQDLEYEWTSPGSVIV